MTEIAARYVQLAAYVTHQEIERRQRFGHPVPQSLRDLDAALHKALLSNPGQQVCQTVTGTTQWETAKERARRLGVDSRTVRRHAHRYGGRKVGQQWAFPLHEEQL